MSKQLRIWLFVLLGTLLASTSLSAQTITMTTSRRVGERIELAIQANGNVTIEGVEETPQTGDWVSYYTLTSQTVTIRGDVTELDCSGNQLTNLNVSECISLTKLNSSRNELTSLDLSGCTSLTELNLYSNDALTSINLSGCQSLKEFSWTYGKLTNLDVSGCTALSGLDCYGNQLTNLDASGCTSLTKLECQDNQLATLDLSGCTSLTKLTFYSNDALTSINLSGCQSLKKFSWRRGNLTSLNVSGCTALTKLECSSNQLTSLDVSSCTALTQLSCGGNRLTSLDLSNCVTLKELYCSGDFSTMGTLTRLNVSGCTALTKLSCSYNQLTTLDLSGRATLTELNCFNNQLTSLDLSGCTALTQLECGINQLTSLNLSGCTALTTLSCKQNPLTSVNLSNCSSLNEFSWDLFSWEGNKLTSLDVSGCTALTKLNCQNSQLTSLDVSSSTALTELNCSKNQLTSLDVSKNTALTELNCSSNQLFSLHLSSCRALTKVDCSSNQLTSLDLSDHKDLTTLSCSDNLLRKIDLSNCPSIVALTCDINQIKESEMTNLVNSLPDLQGKEVGNFRVFNETREHEGNVCLSGHVATAKAKNWKTQFKRDYYGDIWYDYTGADKPTFAVTNESTRGGSVTITGASNLNSVVKGTELTVVATPAEGYELTALTANGVDILATKRFVVTEATVVKATFELITYSVKTSKLGEGTLNVSGADDLDAVMPDTELTIEATPAEGYELTKLTANDKNILDTKKVVVNEDQIIKAIFSQKTFKVSLTKHGNGTIRAIGADNLDAVPYGTELTIEATPAESSELTSLVAGGLNIIETKKVTIKKETTIEAVFTTRSFVVTLTKEGEGMVTATGADDLDAVAYGMELTIVATPAEGYELTALTANGTDILASKKVIVKEALEVKATFTKKSFAVTLTHDGEGDLDAAGSDDLKAVPYGTKLTVTATPAAGYELTALTANGKDILATKNFIVQGATEIRATFSIKHFAIIQTQEGEGKVDVTGADDLNAVAYGTELTINATPAEGYELTALTANGTDILATKKIVVKDNLTVKATFAKKNFAVSLTKEGEGTISATGASNLNSVAYGTELTIVATPAEGYELVSITAGGTDITASKKVVVTGNLTVKATFAKKSFAVSLTKEGDGTITATGASNLNSVAYGTELTIVATPAEGYELTALTANGTDILATKKVVVTDNMTVKATFAKKSFAVSLTKEGEGTIAATGASNLNAVAYGTELTINATPAEGYELTALTANGTDILATKKIVVKDNTTVKATFAKKSFAVSLTKVGEGTISATGASNLNSVAYGTELTINATPAEGYELVSITAGGTDITASRKVVVTGNLTVKATFAKKSFAVSLTKEGDGTITATGASNLNSVAYGTELTIVATPAEGYELTALTANGTNILATKKVVVEGNLTVKATFEKKTFAVTLTSNEHGDITIVEPVNLEAVSYGTTLTVKATGKNAQCELTALTANGKDILATKSFVVTDATEVKATFVDHTGVETTVMQQVKLYPNPSTDYVIVEGVAPASEVTLHSMTGERLYAGRADDRGTLQIDLTPYADGVYLVCVAGETYRVVVRH